MGLTDLFNKWIVERGSAVVQEKHIALFRDQLVVADKQFSVLTEENSDFKTKIEQLTKDNKELRSKIHKYEQPFHNNLLQEFTFIDPPGYYTHPKYSYPICPSCLNKTKSISPVSKEGYCTVCKEPLSGTLGDAFTVEEQS